MSFMEYIENLATGIVALFSTDDRSSRDVEMGSADQGGSSRFILETVSDVVLGEGVSAPAASTSVQDRRGLGEEEIGEVGEVSLAPGTVADTTISASPGPLSASNPTSAIGANAANVEAVPDGRDNRVRMRASSDGCGLSLPLTRDGKIVLLGLAIVAVLIGFIALGITVVQSRKTA
ncbi:hypothetical protein K488DRAFT_89269 [Vararia minispora EC-137]|uniref:Uncharacterized protein n=1 Tax=Vararia minispora EC-137 TaxID=1314806 RepID=A0ACB8QCA0_9AGAM|nr:hypothetical protein K488DRAFT_89269 [Vararia minispora EC-137]